MRFGALCLFVGACGFETQVQPSGDFGAPDATKPPDAAPDAPPDAPAKVCAAAYIAVPAAQTQSKYRRVQVQTEWLVAKADCESDGGHIVIPETTTEAMAVHAFVDPLSSSPYFWAGISDPELDGSWMTVTGVPFTAITWGDNDPDQRTGEIYAIVFSDGKYFDWFDYGTQEYACECEP
jgi:hypothetical protein